MTLAHSCLRPPYTVFEESCTAHCSYGNAAIFKDRGFHCIDWRFRRSLVSDPTPPYPTCEALTSSIGDLLLNGSSSGTDCASWTIGESCAVTHVEGKQPTKPVVFGRVCARKSQVMRFSRWGCRSACRWFVRLMTRQRVSATRAMTFRLKAVVWPLAQQVMKLKECMSATSVRLPFVG